MEATKNSQNPEKQENITDQIQLKGGDHEKDVKDSWFLKGDQALDELKQLEEANRQLENELNGQTEEAKDDAEDADERSIFVKNVDYSADPQEVKEHFQECGEIKRITIPVDKLTNQPKGFAYIEFVTKEGAMKAKRLNESLFKGRQITVMPKRKNLPGKGRAAMRGGKNPLNQLVGVLSMMMGQRGGRGGRGRGGFKPF